jgi:hypothetical protein
MAQPFSPAACTVSATVAQICPGTHGAVMLTPELLRIVIDAGM